MLRSQGACHSTNVREYPLACSAQVDTTCSLAHEVWQAPLHGNALAHNRGRLTREYSTARRPLDPPMGSRALGLETDPATCSTYI